MNRVFFWISVAFWLVMMGLLLRSDVLPEYMVDENPGYSSVLKGLDAPKTWEMIVYKDDREVGTSHTSIVPAPDGSFAIANATNIELQLGMLVSKVQATLEVKLGKDKELTDIFLTVNALGARADVIGKRDGNTLNLKVTLNGQSFNEQLPYENGLVSSYFEPFVPGNRLKVGQAWNTKILDPLSRSFTTAQVRVVGKETLELSLREGEPKRKFETYKIVMDWGTNRLQAWATETGDILKQETPLGYTLVRRETTEDDSNAGSVEILRRQMRRQESQPES